MDALLVLVVGVVLANITFYLWLNHFDPNEHPTCPECKSRTITAYYRSEIEARYVCNNCGFVEKTKKPISKKQR